MDKSLCLKNLLARICNNSLLFPTLFSITTTRLRMALAGTRRSASPTAECRPGRWSRTGRWRQRCILTKPQLSPPMKSEATYANGYLPHSWYLTWQFRWALWSVALLPAGPGKSADWIYDLYLIVGDIRYGINCKVIIALNASDKKKEGSDPTNGFFFIEKRTIALNAILKCVWISVQR